MSDDKAKLIICSRIRLFDSYSYMCNEAGGDNRMLGTLLEIIYIMPNEKKLRQRTSCD